MNELPNWFDSIHCTSGVHCVRCRDRIAGCEWRAKIAAANDIADGPDFACPHGKEWSETAVDRQPVSAPVRLQPVPQVSRIGNYLEQILEREFEKINCEDCRKEVQALNELTPAQVRARLPQIVKGIVQRGRYIAPKLYQRLASRLAPGLTGEMIKPLVIEAIEKEESDVTPLEYQRSRVPPGVIELPPSDPRHPLGRSVTRWAVGVTTAPRQTPTIDRCIESLKASGFHPFVFAEPGSDVELDCPVVQRPQRLGCWRNYVQTLRDLLQLHPQAAAIAVFQDDIEVCRDLREFLEHDLWPSRRTGVVSVYSPEEYESGPAVGIDKRAKMILGLQAAIYPRAVAERLVSAEFSSDWRGCHDPRQRVDQLELKKAADTWVAESIKAMRLGVYHYRPSLAQHLPSTSTIGHGGVEQRRQGKHYRKSANFVGPDQSAFAVWRHHMPWCRWTQPRGVQRYRVPTEPLPQRPVTVIIPGYGCPDLTRDCLQHLERSTVRPQVIYVDNGSSPEEFAQVQQIQTSLDVRHIRWETNRGWTTANNAGIELADPESHILLLNNDTRIGPHCIERLRWHAELHRGVAALGPLTGDDGAQSLKHRDHVREAKYGGDFARDRYLAETEQQLTRQLALSREVLSGFCLFLNRAALDQLGPLSTAPHLASGLVADDEWCLRAVRSGWFNLVVYNAWCAHLHKSTFQRQGIDRSRLHRQALAGQRKG